MRSLVVLSLAILTACSRFQTTPLADAARRGDLSAIDSLLDSGADPDQPSGNAWTPLMHAIHKNQPRSVIRLLDRGAQVNETTKGGLTALMMAAGYGRHGTVRILLAHGANPWIRNQQGLSALDMALTGISDIDDFTLGRCQTETVKLLIARSPQTVDAPKACPEIQLLVQNANFRR